MDQLSICANCKFRWKQLGGNPDGVCRRFPPTVAFMLVDMQKNALNQMVPILHQHSGFPGIMSNWTCGEFAPRADVVN